jgi:hypothetical protein
MSRGLRVVSREQNAGYATCRCPVAEMQRDRESGMTTELPSDDLHDFGRLTQFT